MRYRCQYNREDHDDERNCSDTNSGYCDCRAAFTTPSPHQTDHAADKGGKHQTDYR